MYDQSVKKVEEFFSKSLTNSLKHLQGQISQETGF